jgi:hypothetical protein
VSAAVKQHEFMAACSVPAPLAWSCLGCPSCPFTAVQPYPRSTLIAGGVSDTVKSTNHAFMTCAPASCSVHAAKGELNGHWIDEKTDEFQERIASKLEVGARSLLHADWSRVTACAGCTVLFAAVLLGAAWRRHCK